MKHLRKIWIIKNRMDRPLGHNKIHFYKIMLQIKELCVMMCMCSMCLRQTQAVFQFSAALWKHVLS